MKITEAKTADLIPYEFNNRRHPEQQVKRIAQSIKEFGFDQPIVVDEKNEIIIGHGRWMAAKTLGYETVPTVQVKDLSEKQIRARRILDNKLQNDSEWDFDNLNLEIDWLEDNEFDVEGWGLNELRIDDGSEEVKEDDFEESEDVETFIKLGDLIELGRHSIVCMDASNAVGVESSMTFTDPPYGINYSDVKGRHKNIANDAEYEQNIIEEAISRGNSRCVYVCCNWQSLPDVYQSLLRIKHPPKACIVWDKGSRIQNLDKFGKRHEFILYSGVFGGEKTIDDDVWQIKRQTIQEHPTAKPIEVCARAIQYSSLSGDVVYDPFLGSGSTLIACEQLGRTCYGMEIEPKYCQVIINRYQKYCADNDQPFECKINGEPYREEETRAA